MKKSVFHTSTTAPPKAVALCDKISLDNDTMQLDFKQVNIRNMEKQGFRNKNLQSLIQGHIVIIKRIDAVLADEQWFLGYGGIIVKHSSKRTPTINLFKKGIREEKKKEMKQNR